MGSVSPINPGVANLLQTLTNINSPVLQSPAEVSALEKASPSDIVQLSVEAKQLESMDMTFGILIGPDTGMATTVANLGELQFSDPALLSTASPADQLANYQAGLQRAETQGLFGTGATSGLSNSLFDVVA